MGPMGFVEVEILLPLGQFLFEIHVPLVRKKQIELFLFRPVGPFDFAVELREKTPNLRNDTPTPAQTLTRIIHESP